MNVISTEQFNATTREQFAQIIAGPPEEAARWLATAAQQGIAAAQVFYGQRLLEGVGVDQDAAAAAAWFRKAAQAKEPMGMNMLGRCHENGWGVESDTTIATYWFRRAAMHDSDWGMYNYATSLILGRGVAVNRAEAVTWLSKAVAVGHVKSMNILGGFYEDGWEVPANLDIAIAYYCQAAEGGDFRGQFNYARTLAQRGQIDLALTWMQRVPETATAAFMEKTRTFCSRSQHAAFRALNI